MRFIPPPGTRLRSGFFSSVFALAALIPANHMPDPDADTKPPPLPASFVGIDVVLSDSIDVPGDDPDDLLPQFQKKWSAMVERFEDSLNNPQTTLESRTRITQLEYRLAQLAARPAIDQIKGVQHLMNEPPYIPDQVNWNTLDYWATPLEFMAQGGDCEDFAIAKYMALRLMGFPRSDMRFDMVMDRQQKTLHAVLVVRHEGQTLVLDNQSQDVITGNIDDIYDPVMRLTWRAAARGVAAPPGPAVR